MSEALTSLASFSTALPWVGANLRPGALRGLLFYVRSSEENSVRRWVTHEFPGRDEPWHEDMGAKTQSFSVEGLIIGADVVLQARAFARAAKDPEVATLLHPWLGAMQVVVQDCRISFDVDQARVARISLRVEKAGTKPAPVISEDGLGSVLADAEEVLTAAQAAYAQYRYMRAAADFVIDSFKASVMGIAGAIEGALANTGQAGAAAGSVAALASMNDAAIPALPPRPRASNWQQRMRLWACWQRRCLPVNSPAPQLLCPGHRGMTPWPRGTAFLTRWRRLRIVWRRWAGMQSGKAWWPCGLPWLRIWRSAPHPCRASSGWNCPA